MANIQLNWSGARASNGIQGYELSYKESSGSTYTNLPFITTSATTGSYTWTSAEFSKDYNIRIRTKDNLNLYSTYKNVNITTIYPDNQPPNTVNSYILDDVTSDSFEITFYGATDDYGIKGHEVSYKLDSDSIYTTLPFITTSGGSFTTYITGLSPTSEYNIRVRTRDILNVWSNSYFVVNENTVGETINNYFRSSGSHAAFTACGFLTLSSDIVYFYGILENGGILYTDSGATTPFNGNNRVWLIGSFDGLLTYSVKISRYGEVSELSSCL